MESLTSFRDALTAFGAAMGSVAPVPLSVALAIHLLSLWLRSVSWRNIIGAALDQETPLAPVACGLLAGVGLNGVVPARGGDALKLYLIHRRLPHASYPLLTSTLLAETLFNSVAAIGLLAWAWRTGVLPSRPQLPGISAFELSWAARHPLPTAALAVALIGVLTAVAIGNRARLSHVWHQVVNGLTIMRQPRTYLRSVVSYQAAAWLLRVVSAWFFLDAFGVTTSLRNAFIVVMLQGVGSALPLTPGGIGPKQALTVVLLDGEATGSTILAFSAGMELTVVAFQFIVGMLAAGHTMEGFRLRSTLATARQEVRADRDGGAPSSDGHTPRASSEQRATQRRG